MTHELLRPKRLLAHIVVVAIATTFVLLGLWQLDRHAERIENNERIAARLDEPPAPLHALLTDAGGDLASIEYRRATVIGVFMPDEEVLVRSQVHLGAAGFHVITPLETGGGAGVLVNRGWVPIFFDKVPVEHALPPPRVVPIEGWVQLSQDRPAFGPTDPDTGHVIIFSRVNIPRIQEQVSIDLAPVYLVMTGEWEGLPENVRLPSFDDTGPHLAYAIQWFGFAIVGLVGYVFLVRRQLQSNVKARSLTTS